VSPEFEVKMEQKEIIKENRSRPKISIVNERMWLLVALGFVILCILTWLNEILDFPHFLMGGIRTPFNWHESIVEMVLIIIVGLFTVSVVIRNIAENKKKEKLLLKFHNELEIKVNGQTAELLRVNEELRTDIIQRKKAEEKLYLYGEITTNMSEGVYAIRASDSVIIYANPKFEEMFGYDPGELIDKHVSIVNAPTDKNPEEMAKEIIEVLNKNGLWQGEIYNIKKDGTAFWCYASVSVIEHPKHGKVWVSIHTDITEHKHADEVLKRDKETFERLVSERTHELFKTQAELDKAKRLSDLGILAATVAHELRNPLGVIKIAAYNIRKKRENSLLDKHLDNIEKKISESGQIINNLLSYSWIKIPSYEKIQIYDILNECIAFMKRRFRKHNISIVKKFKSTEKKLIEADPLQIREIFNNILTNAYQSVSNKKGKIEISERDDGKGSIEISFKDNGMGIDKKDLERIFEPFFTRKSKGTGLGLTICNELVNLHGGRIDIKSKKSKETSVTVSLPIKRETK